MPYTFKFRRGPGVYKITNISNGKIYVGSSKDIAQRLFVHRYNLRNNTHQNKHLQNAWNKYGEDSFVFEPILYCEIMFLQDYESHLIRKWKANYNKAFTFNKYNGVPRTYEQIRKTADKLLGRSRPKHVGVAISESMSGENHYFCRLLDSEISELRKVCKYSYKTQNKIADAWGLSQPYISRLIRSERRP